ncbi:hypothetical protein ACFHW0_20625 [Micromonospora sp. LOL_025]|uniref:hypothetical protein n=1 Tax=Micromonospora sp. LOL_025 TaxID=3345413 RepID=UPI003A84302A
MDLVDAEPVLVRPEQRLTRVALPGNVRTVGWIPPAAALPGSGRRVPGRGRHRGAGTGTDPAFGSPG